MATLPKMGRGARRELEEEMLPDLNLMIMPDLPDNRS
jgi:hypothetical protein